MRFNPIKILLVEDDDVDAFAIERGFEKEKIANTILRARDGVEAIEMLRGQASGASRLERPFLVFLDLNLPRMDGFQVLKAIREDESLKDTVVFVLTTSTREEDRVRAYGHNVSGFVSKANAGRDFVHLVHLIDHFWRVVELP